MKVKEVIMGAEPERARREPELSADEVVRGYRTIMKKVLPISVKKAVA